MTNALYRRIQQDTEKLFLGPNSFSEQIIIFPRGVISDPAPEPTMGNWDADGLPGTNEVEGDGRTLNTKQGRADRQSILIDMSSDEPIQRIQNDLSPDVIKRVSTGQMVTVKRIESSDPGGMMTVLAIDKKMFRRQSGMVSG